MIVANARTSRSVALTRSMGSPHFVYRCYDADDRLLYVGCTMTAERRIAQHQHSKAGSTLASRVLAVCMTRVEISEAYPDRDSGRTAEAALIRSAGPLLNFDCSSRPGWMTLSKIATYLTDQGIDIESVGMSRCLYCQHLRPYRTSGWLCTDCREDADFRAYIDRRDRMKAAS